MTQLRRSLGARPWIDEPGSETSIVVIGQEVIVGWYSRPLGAALLTRRAGSSFDTVTVSGRDGSDTGRGMTLAAGPAGELAMAYQNRSHDRLEIHFGTTSSGLLPVRTEPGGFGIDLAFNQASRLIVAHGTAAGAAVEVWIGPTNWVRHVPFSTGYVGRFNAIWPHASGALVATVRDELNAALEPNPMLVTADLQFE